MTVLVLDMRFTTNVRFGTGAASGGLDEVIDRSAPLSAAAIKGVLRDEARLLLPGAEPDPSYVRAGFGDTSSGRPLDGSTIKGDHPFVKAVFGDTRSAQSPWNFDVRPVGSVQYTRRANVRLDENGAVAPGAFLVKEEASISRATVEIHLRSPLTGAGLPEALQPRERDCHLALLHVAARAAEKVGQRRTRGMGWVAFTSDRDVNADLDLVWTIREGRSG